MNILGIDYGKKRIGLAWSDDAMGMVLPYGVIEEQDELRASVALCALIKNEHIDHLVFGLPLDLDGHETEQTKKIRLFASTIQDKSGLPIDFLDERFSSRQADQMSGDASRDEKSAMVIVQSFLDQR